MADELIVAQLPLFPDSLLPPKQTRKWPDLHTFWQRQVRLPDFVCASPTVMRNLELLGPLNWAHFPERNLERHWGQSQIPFAALAAAELIKLNDGRASWGALRRYLVEHPGFIWLAGFPLTPAPNDPLGFNAQASLPTHRHLLRMLRQVPNAALQFLLADSVRLILTELAGLGLAPPECISLDTKHILAWVKQNNPKTYVPDRFNKARQPAGDPDCRLGCKRRTNQGAAPATPTHNPISPQTLKRGQYYWGYGSGVVVTKVPAFGEFVLAELTQPFDQGDVTYFFPLMAQTEARLGYRPRVGTFDAAFDAWYVYDYFHRENDPAGGFAAVPFSAKGGYKADGRQFSPEGLPLCAAGLAMPLQFTFTDRTSCLIEHERGKYVCPLPRNRSGRVACPVHHTNAKRGGCTAMTPALAAQVQVCPPASAPAYVIRSTAKARRTKTPTDSAAPSSASTARRWPSASNGLTCATATPSPTRTHSSMS